MEKERSRLNTTSVVNYKGIISVYPLWKSLIHITAFNPHHPPVRWASVSAIYMRKSDWLPGLPPVYRTPCIGDFFFIFYC